MNYSEGCLMAENTIRVGIEGLENLRITCRCGGSLELKIAQLKAPVGWLLICPSCGAHLRKPSEERNELDALDKLEGAIRALKDVPGVQFAFVVPAPADGGKGI
jgi:hypothetical protein